MMMILSLVLLLMAMCIGCNFMLRLRAQCHVAPAAPVDRCSLSGTKLAVGGDKKALQVGERGKGGGEGGRGGGKEM